MKDIYQKLVRNLKFYHDNRARFELECPGKYLLIWEQGLAGVYQTYEEALVEATDKYDPGTFLVKHLQPVAPQPKIYINNGIFQAARTR